MVPQSIKTIFFKKKRKKLRKRKEKQANSLYINFLIIAEIIVQEYKLVLRYFIMGWVLKNTETTHTCDSGMAHRFLMIIS